MSSWDVEEVCGRSIPQLKQGSKRAGVKVGSPVEGQAHRRSGAARILGIEKIRGADAPLALAGVLHLNQALLKPAFQIYLDL